ncbi:MAG: LacI family DNA-binding transcriptional regulator [Alphaproteobacteria bacterium]|nr:LacI family DNA-binding transcriptional regulator [Alphaproteobacteria bacterium]
MTNQKQIAQKLGISIATVSNALTGKGRVSANVIEQVLAHAKQMAYVPDAAGRALKTGRTGIIGLVIPDITQPVFPDFAEGIEAAADEYGYGVLIGNSRRMKDNQAKTINQLIQRGVDGLIIVPQRGTKIQALNVPFAVISTATDPSFTVVANHKQGGQLSAKSMLDIGHRKFVILGDDCHSPVENERIAGMVEELENVASYEVFWAQDEFPDLLAQHKQGVTAVLTVSDLLALRVITESSNLGLRCPKDLSVLGFDNLPLATAVRPTLTSIVPNTAELSKRSIEYLDAAIRRNVQLPPPSIVNMSIEFRESTAALTAKI